MPCQAKHQHEHHRHQKNQSHTHTHTHAFFFSFLFPEKENRKKTNAPLGVRNKEISPNAHNSIEKTNIIDIFQKKKTMMLQLLLRLLRSRCVLLLAASLIGCSVCVVQAFTVTPLQQQDHGRRYV